MSVLNGNFDALGRATGIAFSVPSASPVVNLSQSFDAASNRTSLSATIGTTADFTNGYVYDQLNRTTRVTQAAQGSGAGFNFVAEKRVDLAYNAIGEYTSLSRYANIAGTAVVANSAFDYDALARLTSLAHQRADNSSINTYDWAYDSLNRITSQGSVDGTSTFSYDSTGQLTGADHSYQADEGYSYDANGNRIDSGNVAGTNNRLTEDAEWTYAYDAEGNTISQTRKSTASADDHAMEFSWDHRNRLTDVVLKNNSGAVTTRVEYDYDVFERMIGRREYVGASTTPSQSEHFVWDGANIALILNDSGAVTERRFNGNAVDAVFASENALNEVTWILADHLGTPRDFINSSGTVLNHRQLDSFGKIVSETNSSIGANIGLTGGYRDRVTGFILRGIRWYNPRTHRWQSEDRIWDGANLSAYVGNNPVSGRDPSGYANAWNPFSWDMPSDPEQGWLGFFNPVSHEAVDSYLAADNSMHVTGFSVLVSGVAVTGDAVNGVVPNTCDTSGAWDVAYHLGPHGQLVDDNAPVWMQSAAMNANVWGLEAALAALGVGLWTHFIGGFGLAFTNQGPYGFHVVFGYGTAGSYSWAHGLGAGYFVTSEGAASAAASAYFIFSEIPILFPSAIAAWVALKPDLGNCVQAAAAALCRGMGGSP